MSVTTSAFVPYRTTLGDADDVTEILLVEGTAMVLAKWTTNPGKLAFTGTDGAAIGDHFLTLAPDVWHPIPIPQRSGAKLYPASGTGSTVIEYLPLDEASAALVKVPLNSPPTGAQVPITDAGGYYTTDYVEQALQQAGAQLAQVSEQVWTMAVLGAWAVDGDGANTNGAGLVGATATLTEAAAAFAKINDGAEFSNLAVAGALAGVTANYQLFPDVPVAETDRAYFGAAIPFAELSFDMSATVATYDAAGVLEWSYWNGTAWAALTIAYDNTHGSTKDGTLTFARDGALTFVPPSDWAATTVDSQEAYWIRVGIAAGKAANMTQVPITNSKEHQIVTPGDGFRARVTGLVDNIRLNDNASTLHTTADVKFVLMNYTTGAHSGELTFAQDVRTDFWTLGTPLSVATGDILGVICTQEDGTAEPSGVILELGVTLP